MKKHFQLASILSIIIICTIAGCQKPGGPALGLKEAQKVSGKVAPGKVKNVKVKNIPGGARISYTLPKDRNLLYVKAIYSTKAGGRQSVKASRYANSLTVRGFYNTSPKKVTLYAYSTGLVASDSVTVTIHPLTPPFKAVFNSLKAQAAFGG